MIIKRWNAAGNVVRSFTLTSGSATLTGTTTDILQGAVISGTGIQTGTTVVSVVGAVITMSATATASGSQSLTFTGGFVKEFPATKAQLVRNNGDTESIFDSSDKIKATYLPNIVFDSLSYSGTIAANGTANEIVDTIGWLLTNGTSGRSGIGFYWVVNASGTINAGTAVQGSTYPTIYMTWTFKNQDGNSTFNSNSGVLEIGDWIVIDDVSGAGTSGNPWVVEISVVNNTYENATTSVDGIVRLSNRSVYANLSGDNVVTEGVLKTVIDNAAFAAGTHTHGNISNDGKITTNTAASSGQHLVITSDADLVQQSAITIGTSTTTYLRNDGSWGTPTGTVYTHPAYTARSVDTSGVDVLDTFTSDSTGHVTAITTRTLPNATTSTAGVMSATDKTKLDGIAASANNYSHPNHTGDVTSVADGATTIASNVVTNAKLAQIATSTIKGRATAGSGNVEDLSAAQVRTILNVADGANNYTHPTYTYTTPTADTQTTLANIQLISTLTQTNGHVTGGTARKLVAGTNVSISAASDGNITISSTDTNTTYSAKALGGLALDGTAFQMNHPLFIQTATPTTPLTGTVWLDIN